MVFISLCVDTMRFYCTKMKIKNHFAIIGVIHDVISFCVDRMWSVLNENLYFALKDDASSVITETPPFKSYPKFASNIKWGNLALVLKCKNDLVLNKTIHCGYTDWPKPICPPPPPCPPSAPPNFCLHYTIL